MKEIPLLTGQSAFVDDEDYERLVTLGPWYGIKRAPRNFVAIYARSRKHGYMHSVIADVNGKRIKIRHLDNNGLNNQKSNLLVRITYTRGVGDIKCRTCKKVLPEDAFFYRNHQECYFVDCRECCAKKPQSTARKRKSHLKREYGMTPDQWVVLFEKQGKRCAICNTDSVPRNFWHTDHCHKTNTVRGILCLRCNLLLGKVDDDPEILKNAIQYLHNFPNREVISDGKREHGDPGQYYQNVPDSRPECGV